jgi:methionyl aminopeptidase
VHVAGHFGGAPGGLLGDIGAIIQKHAEKNGYSVVREFCGHGIGSKFHEDPQVLHYGKAGTGPLTGSRA